MACEMTGNDYEAYLLGNLDKCKMEFAPAGAIPDCVAEAVAGLCASYANLGMDFLDYRSIWDNVAINGEYSEINDRDDLEYVLDNYGIEDVTADELLAMPFEDRAGNLESILDGDVIGEDGQAAIVIHYGIEDNLRLATQRYEERHIQSTRCR